MQLHQIGSEYRRIGELILESAETGEVAPELEVAFSAVEDKLEVKAMAICSLHMEMKADAATAKAEADRLALRSQSRNNAADRLKQYLWDELTKMGMTKLKTELFSMGERRNSQASIKFDGDVATLPGEFQRIPPPELDREKVLAAYKDLTPLPAAISVTTGKHFRIW